MAAFLGCFAVLAIAAGSSKAKSQENCGEEWKKCLQPETNKTVAACERETKQEVVFPVQLFHAVL